MSQDVVHQYDIRRSNFDITVSYDYITPQTIGYINNDISSNDNISSDINYNVNNDIVDNIKINENTNISSNVIEQIE